MSTREQRVSLPRGSSALWSASELMAKSATSAVGVSGVVAIIGFCDGGLVKVGGGFVLDYVNNRILNTRTGSG